jgi:predicted DNA binding protein
MPQNGIMELRQAIIGVHHHDCWGSKCTEPFPDIKMTESGPVIVEKKRDYCNVRCAWNVEYPTLASFSKFHKQLKQKYNFSKLKILSKSDRKAFLYTAWKGISSSYDTALQNHCLHVSPVIQKDGYEVYTLISEKPTEVKKVLNSLSQVGETKIFKVGFFEENENPYVLSDKQLSALQVAFSNNYYSWPRTIGLDELSTIAHLKRRTFQENLRKAEAKVFPNVLNNVLFK